ncbi:hypothetical protein T265_07512 [Opisthorchis viverrini]|uniref:Uncharacterized protein n=1 Tax=Opisthorchis viverrini TaxID=6198 RepID=A0A074ZNN9_OPIVI|nr:hypothetical protein T265_07512 [Opisthorchis viverrini]KER24950.1 hypothetical protein T265_07512 [Opisthorchis viverrini]
MYLTASELQSNEVQTDIYQLPTYETPSQMPNEPHGGGYQQVSSQARILPPGRIPCGFHPQLVAATAEKSIPQNIGQKFGMLVSQASSRELIGRNSGPNSQSQPSIGQMLVANGASQRRQNFQVVTACTKYVLALYSVGRSSQKFTHGRLLSPDGSENADTQTSGAHCRGILCLGPGCCGQLGVKSMKVTTGIRKDKCHSNTDRSTSARDAKFKGHVGIGERGHGIKEQPVEPSDRITNRGQMSSPATSTYINTQVTLLNAQPPTHRYAHLRTDDVTSIGDETFATKLPSSANKPTTIYAT